MDESAKIMETLRNEIDEHLMLTGKKPEIMVLSPAQWKILKTDFDENAFIIPTRSNSKLVTQEIKTEVKALLQAAGFTGYEPWIILGGVCCIQRIEEAPE